MNSELKKSLVALIDETLNELEELKKSRFSAAEISLDGPGSDGIAGKPANGKIDKAEDEEDEEEMDKADDCGPMDKAEDDKEDEEDEEEMDKAKDEDEDEEDEKKKEKMDKKKYSPEKSDKDMKKLMEKQEAMKYEMKKSREEMTSLIKSFVDERIAPLEDKLSTLVDLVNKLADQPIAPRGVSSRVTPLAKSAEEFGEPLSKAQVTSKLLELKKSGVYPVDSLDVAKAEMGHDLDLIIKKYKIT
jgi:hypothetical protein